MVVECSVSGILNDAQGNLVTSKLVSFERVAGVTGEGEFTIVPNRAEAVSDGSGNLAVTLYSGAYIGRVKTVSENMAFSVVVPATATADLEDCIAAGAASVPAKAVFDTRAEFVTGVGAGFAAADGQLVFAGGLTYAAEAGATGISDLLGFAPFGEVSFGHWGPTADGTTDDAAPLLEFFAYLDTNKKQGRIPAATYAVSFARNRALVNGLHITCDPGVTIKGTTTKAIVAGDDATTEYTVSEFTKGNDGFHVVYITGGNETLWTEGTEFTVTDQTIDWGEGTTPHGPLATGDSLRIVSQNDVLELGSSSTFTGDFVWRGGTIDNSLRGFAPNTNSGTGLNILDFDRYLVEGTTFQGSTSWVQAQTDGVTDAGLGPTRCNRGLVSNCKFIGQADLGIYITGGSLTADTDDGVMHLVTGCHFYRCHSGAGFKRSVRGVHVLANVFEECRGGVLFVASSGGGEIGAIGAVAAGNTFRKMGRRGVWALRIKGFSIHDNIIDDVGYEPDGATQISGAVGIQVEGCEHGQVHSNQIRLVDWATTPGQKGIRLDQDATYAPTLENTNITIRDNMIDGVPTGINENDASVNVKICNNTILNTTDDAMDATADQRWHYFDSTGADVEGIGSTLFDGTWTPEFTFASAAGSPSFGYSTQDGQYRRQGNMVFITCEIQASVTHSETAKVLRVTGLPYTPRNTINQDVSGGISKLLNVAYPTGATQLTPQVAPNATYVTFEGIGASLSAGVNVKSDQITTGQTVRIDFSMSYEVEP